MKKEKSASYWLGVDKGLAGGQIHHQSDGDK